MLGTCHICGIDGELSKEHVPPQKAFNDKRVVTLNFENMITLGPDVSIKGPVKQGGISFNTLCLSCNNKTGSWYGSDFINWCYQGMNILELTNGKPTLIYMNYIYPLRIIKQIITMFFSINGSSFRLANQELEYFVLNKFRKYLSPKFRIFTYFNIEGIYRYIGISGRSNLFTGEDSIFSELNYPPFGYILLTEGEPPDKRLFEVSHFANYDYYDFRVMNLRLPLLPTLLNYPGDYRTKEEIDSDYLKNISKKQSNLTS